MLPGRSRSFKLGDKERNPFKRGEAASAQTFHRRASGSASALDRVTTAADTTVVKVLAYYPNGNVSQGTGWFADSRVLVTDYHVVHSAISYEVIYADRMVRTAKLWNWSAACDLAALEVQEPRAEKYLSVVADSNKAHPNEPVKAISYPRGNRTISQGKLTRAYWSDTKAG